MMPIQLPQPNLDMSYPLMHALQERRTIRKWQSSPVSMQDLSNLLWAACGITQEAKGKTKAKRTVPSACNSQEIKVYVLKEDGVFLYEEYEHVLIEVSDEDIRSILGKQKMMQNAPLGLVLVADLSRFTSPYVKNLKAQEFTAWVDTGYVSQNIYLYCTAANLGTTALFLIDRNKLEVRMQLGPHEKIVMTHAVGYVLEND